MADLSDVTALLATLATSAVYPNGISNPSIVNMDIRVMEGWPIPAQLDLDMAGQQMAGTPPAPVPRPGGKVPNVSIYPMPGAAAEVFQILDDTYVIVAPGNGLSFTVAGDVITVTGTPNVGEYLTAILHLGTFDDGLVISSNQPTLPLMLNDLVTQAINGGFGLASTDGVSTLTLPGVYQLVVRQGSIGTLAKVTHRQRHGVQVTVWAPDHTSRSILAAAIDVLIKENLVVTLPDTSQCVLTYNRTSLSDEMQAETIYRRDLVYLAEYATLQQFPGYVITSATLKIQGGNWYLPSPPPVVTTDP